MTNPGLRARRESITYAAFTQSSKESVNSQERPKKDGDSLPYDLYLANTVHHSFVSMHNAGMRMVGCGSLTPVTRLATEPLAYKGAEHDLYGELELSDSLVPFLLRESLVLLAVPAACVVEIIQP